MKQNNKESVKKIFRCTIKASNASPLTERRETEMEKGQFKNNQSNKPETKVFFN